MTVITTGPEHGPPPPEPPGSWEYLLQVPHNPLSPTVIRATIRTVLGRHGLAELVATAELLASELATNAYRCSIGPVSVHLRWTDGTLRIGVWDTNPTLPSPVAATPNSERGRGLQLVRMCADDCRRHELVDRHLGASGKVVWLEIKGSSASTALVR